MLKKIIASILIPAFLLQVAGCYSVNEVTKDDITLHNNKIKSVVLNDGSKISFNSEGGMYFFDQGSIEGNDSRDNYIKLTPTNVRALYKDRFKSFPLDSLKNGRNKIYFAVLNNSTLLEFGKNGCIIDTNKNVITGKLVSGDYAWIDLIDVRDLYVHAPDTISIYDSSSSVACLLTKDNHLINLNESSVKYEPAKAEIIGKTKIGKSTSINLKDVKSIEAVERDNPIQIIAFGIGLLSLGGFIAAIATGCKFDFNIDLF